MTRNVASEIRFDWRREARTGLPEAVFSQGKDAAQLRALADDARARGRALFFTRMDPEGHGAIAAPDVDYDPLSRTAVLGALPLPELADRVAVVAAGTADMPVAAEARRALAFMGAPAPLVADVGVAGLWRLLDAVQDLRRYQAIVAVAGMEGALFSVLAGLVPGLVVAVPTSVGYGVSAGGKAALSSALASCAPGLVTVNIDNGFGAACAVVKMLRAAPSPSTPGT